MAETRKYTKAGRRNILNANSLVAKSGEYTVVCAPISALEIARAFLRQRGLWRTSYAVSYGDNEYTLPDDETMAVIEQMILEFLEVTTQMDCNDLVTELSAIEQAINGLSMGGGCGCGSGGAGGTSPPADTTDTGDITGGTGTPPEGYPDWDTYQQAKCDIAYWIVNNMLDDIGWWQTISIADLTVTALVAGMASVLSGFTLTALLAALAGLWAYSTSVLEQMDDSLTADIDDLVCVILSGETAQGSMDNFISEIETVLSADISDPIALYLAETVAEKFADPAQFNLLYAPYDDYLGHQIPGGNDCQGCGIPCTTIQMNYGEYLGGGLFSSLHQDNHDRIGFYLNTNTPSGGDPCAGMEDVTIDSLLGHTSVGSGHDFRVYEDDSPVQLIYESDTSFSGMEFCCRYIGVLSDTPFTMTITRGGKCS